MNKIIKVLLCLILIGIFVCVTLSGYMEKKLDTSRKIGMKWSGGYLSTTDYSGIHHIFEDYLKYLKNGNYEYVYSLVPYEYSLYKTYDDFVVEAKNFVFENANIIEIVRRTEYLYSVIIEFDGEKSEYLIMFNEDNTRYSITPEPFLEYSEINKKLKRKNVEYEILSTRNYTNKYIVEIKISNLSKNEIAKISKINLYNGRSKITSENFHELVIAPLENKTFEVEFKTYIEFPDRVKISRIIESKDIQETYVFDI